MSPVRNQNPKGRLELTWKGKDLALIPAEHGKYDYSWVDPSDPRACEVKSIECLERVGAPDGRTGSDENLLIQGDSGDALRALGKIPEWSAKYTGKVKLVYIDPPFNTEQTFEHYADQLEHSVWLTMMRDRIRDIQPLMSDDASIWVHLDDAEVHRMRLLLDEEFGPENFVATILWQRVDNPSSRTSGKIVPSHDFILVYSRSQAFTPNRRLVGELPPHYDKRDEEGRPYCSRSLRKAGTAALRTDRPSMWFPITSPTGDEVWPIRSDGTEGRWQWGEAKVERDYDLLEWLPSPRGQLEPFIRIYPPDEYTAPFHTWWPYAEVDSNRISKMEIKALVPGITPFSTPKPERLLERIISIGSDPGDIVLDCFGGSGTTAAVAHKMGRRWVTVELQQSTVDAFLKPRLTKVVEGQDPGGITTKTERVAVGDLPEGITVEEAQRFTSLLGKVAKSIEGLDDTTLKALRAATKTKDESTAQWQGGGGFRVARLGPSMYDVDDEDGTVYLSDAATNGAWSRAVAGQLGYTLTPDHPVFCGVKRRMRLAVVDGVADEQVVRTVVEHLGDGERAVIVAKAALPGAEALLKDLSPGSRLRKAPDDLFPKATVK